MPSKVIRQHASLGRLTMRDGFLLWKETQKKHLSFLPRNVGTICALIGCSPLGARAQERTAATTTEVHLVITALRMQPGQLVRRDYECKRCGTANIFCVATRLRTRRHLVNSTLPPLIFFSGQSSSQGAKAEAFRSREASVPVSHRIVTTLSRAQITPQVSKQRRG